MTELGLFFKYSPKRTRLLESIIDEENKKSKRKKKIPVQTVKVFCESRWIQRHVVLEEVQLLYEPILQTLETITSEKGWEHKTEDSANDLLKNIMESTFLVALNVCSYTLGFTKQLSSMLQGTAIDVIEAYKQIELVKTQLNSLQGNCDEVFMCEVWPKVKELAHIADIKLSTPHQCGRQTKRSNVPSVTTDEYFKQAVFIPVIDHLMAELEFRFSCIQVNGTQGLYLIPENLSQMSNVERDKISKFFDWVLPYPATFNQEIEPNGRQGVFRYLTV